MICIEAIAQQQEVKTKKKMTVVLLTGESIKNNECRYGLCQKYCHSPLQVRDNSPDKYNYKISPSVYFDFSQ